MKTLDEVAEVTKELPEELQSEVRDFAKFLKESKASPKRTRFRLDWAGAGRHLRGKFTSVELQHKALELWGD
ncbi:MAG: DUF2281 domain-containing protein [candidate division WOR-3 bacterium]|nr:DUF2281 domain-containing protein [candidate division WOR-3 bacterium]